MTTLYVNRRSELHDVFEEASEDSKDVVISEAVYRGNAETFASLVVDGLLHVARKAGMEAALTRQKMPVMVKGTPPPVPPRARRS